MIKDRYAPERPIATLLGELLHPRRPARLLRALDLWEIERAVRMGAVYEGRDWVREPRGLRRRTRRERWE
jgi:hypothetical protein